MKKKPTKVVLVDDHDMVRAGIRSILERTEEIEVIGEARDGLEAMDLVQELVPDIVLLDVEMPRMSGRRVAQELRERELPVRVIALSAYDDNQYILGMLSRGVAGYLTKDEVPNLLIHAIRGVANGEEGWVSNRVAERIASWSRFGKADRATLTNTDPIIDGQPVSGYGAAALRPEGQDFRDAFNAQLQNLKDSGELVEIIGQFEGFGPQNDPGDATADELCQP